MPLGLVLSLIRVARLPVLSQIVVLYVSLGRATPLVTLVLFLFVTLPVFGVNIDRYTAGVVALTLNTASFNTEVWRSAYQAFPQPQIEPDRIVNAAPRLPRPTTTRLPRPFAQSARFVQHGHHYGHEAEIMLEVSVAKARNALTQLIHEAEGGKVVHITRRGKSVAVLISREEYDRLESQDSKRDFWQAIEDWRAQASFDWPELTPEEVDGWRDRHPGREFSWPD